MTSPKPSSAPDLSDDDVGQIVGMVAFERLPCGGRRWAGPVNDTGHPMLKMKGRRLSAVRLVRFIDTDRADWPTKTLYNTCPDDDEDRRKLCLDHRSTIRPNAGKATCDSPQLPLAVDQPTNGQDTALPPVAPPPPVASNPEPPAVDGHPDELPGSDHVGPVGGDDQGHLLGTYEASEALVPFRDQGAQVPTGVRQVTRQLVGLLKTFAQVGRRHRRVRLLGARLLAMVAVGLLALPVFWAAVDRVGNVPVPALPTWDLPAREQETPRPPTDPTAPVETTTTVAAPPASDPPSGPAFTMPPPCLPGPGRCPSLDGD